MVPCYSGSPALWVQAAENAEKVFGPGMIKVFQTISPRLYLAMRRGGLFLDQSRKQFDGFVVISFLI